MQGFRGKHAELATIAGGKASEFKYTVFQQDIADRRGFRVGGFQCVVDTMQLKQPEISDRTGLVIFVEGASERPLRNSGGTGQIRNASGV